MNISNKIDPKHTALIVIDIQKDFAAPDGLLAGRGRDLSLVEPMLEKLQRAIACAQRAGVLTLYTQQIYDRSKLNPLQLEQYDLDNKFVTCDIVTDGWQFYKLSPDPACVFIKHNFNAFSNPDFVRTLQTHNIKTLIITGMDTIYCVETAIRNGFDLGYKIVVPEDLVAGNGKHMDMHNRTLELVRKVYGAVTTAAEIENIWDNSQQPMNHAAAADNV